MVSPMIDLASTATGSGAELSFYMHAYGTEIGTLDVGVGTSAAGPFTSVFTWTGQYQFTANDPWSHVGVDISAYSGQQIYIAFDYTDAGTSWYGDMAIDLVRVQSCVSCVSPSNLMTSNATATSVDLDWTANGTETAWNIEYGPSGFAQGTGTVVQATTNPYTVTGLSSFTGYDFMCKQIVEVEMLVDGMDQLQRLHCLHVLQMLYVQPILLGIFQQILHLLHYRVFQHVPEVCQL